MNEFIPPGKAVKAYVEAAKKVFKLDLPKGGSKKARHAR
jgi:hypothetical protein